MATVTLVLVGGFLGSGKTTLLARAAERLAARGRRVGLITNDQAANLVDTEVLLQAGRAVQEVAGACFCCAFNKLLYVCDHLVNTHRPDVIVAEPVGSCTDLSATVLQPMKEFYADRFAVAPYSVLVDPARIQQHLGAPGAAGVADAVRYIYARQIQEADLIVLNKTDALGRGAVEKITAALTREFPQTPIVALSALTGAGVDEWLDRVLSGAPAGQRIADVDYDTYAAGEAALGWLNAAVDLAAPEATDWSTIASDFLRRLQAAVRERSAEMAHVKLLLTAEGGALRASLTDNDSPPVVQGAISTPSRFATLLVNARVRTGPKELKTMVEACLRAAAGDRCTVAFAELTSLRPGRPEPVHRYSSVVPPPGSLSR
jgi:Ni2+-binding GTPase involved in maturation of urease and hydrogenase